MRFLCIKIIWMYRYFISPLLGYHCRFHPSCSEYATEAVTQRGVWMGGWLTLKRLMRCHPGYPGGYDPVPELNKPK